jgi:hypothetical protein
MRLYWLRCCRFLDYRCTICIRSRHQGHAFRLDRHIVAILLAMLTAACYLELLKVAVRDWCGKLRCFISHFEYEGEEYKSTFFALRSFSVDGETKLSSVFAVKLAFFFSSSSTNETVPSSALRMWSPRNLHFNPIRQEPVVSKGGHRVGKSTDSDSDSKGSSDSSSIPFAAALGKATNGGSLLSMDSEGKKMSLGFALR